MRAFVKIGILSAIAILTIVPTVGAQSVTGSDEVLTNEQVVTMVKASLPSSLIVNKIRTSRNNFNTSTGELVRLQQLRVPAEILNAMVEASTSASTIASRTGAGDVSKADPNDPSGAHEAGIYLFEEKNGERLMTQLEPSISTQSKSGGFLTHAMTYGIAKIKSKAVIANNSARLQLNNARPVFYFYFEVKNAGLSNSGNAYSGSSTSPNEFVLVKMDQKKKARELVVGQVNLFGAESGTLDKYSRAFDYEKIAPGVYKVIPRTDLDDGGVRILLRRLNADCSLRVLRRRHQSKNLRFRHSAAAINCTYS